MYEEDKLLDQKEKKWPNVKRIQSNGNGNMSKSMVQTAKEFIIWESQTGITTKLGFMR